MLKFSVEYGADLLKLIRTVEQTNELHFCLQRVSLTRLPAGYLKCSGLAVARRQGRIGHLAETNREERGNKVYRLARAGS